MHKITKHKITRHKITEEECELDNLDRVLAYRLLELPFVTGLKILSGLNLISKEDNGYSRLGILGRIFKDAREKKVLDKLWDRVELAEPRGRR